MLHRIPMTCSQYDGLVAIATDSKIFWRTTKLDWFSLIHPEITWREDSEVRVIPLLVGLRSIDAPDRIHAFKVLILQFPTR